MKHFYQRLKHYRVKKGIQVKEMAEKLNIPLSTYRDWEYGRSIKGEPYEKIANILNISISELLTGKSSTPKEIMKQVIELECNLKQLRKELESFF